MRFLKLSRAVALALGLSACGGSATLDETPLNGVLISLDTLRADHMGLHGYRRDTTPFLDELAQQSRWFHSAYATSAWTLISHASMLSGLEPELHGVVHGEAALPRRMPLLAEQLETAGVQTFATYFPGWIGPERGFGRGFQRFEPAPNAAGAEEQWRAFLAERDPQRSSFLFIHLFDIHSGNLERRRGPIYQTPKPYDDLFVEGAAGWFKKSNPKRVWDQREVLSEAQLRAMIALYDGGVRYVDDQLRRWFDEWRASGFLDRALVVVTGDHGEGLGTRDRVINNHGGFWQEGLRIPLIVHRTYGAADYRGAIETQVSLIDVAPTFLAAFDVAGARPGNGVDLLGVIPKERVVGALQEEQHARIRGVSKLIRNGGGSTLYHLIEDPFELNPIRDKGAAHELYGRDLEADFQAQLKGYGEPYAPETIARSAEDRAHLESLGYTE